MLVAGPMVRYAEDVELVLRVYSSKRNAFKVIGGENARAVLGKCSMFPKATNPETPFKGLTVFYREGFPNVGKLGEEQVDILDRVNQPKMKLPGGPSLGAAVRRQGDTSVVRKSRRSERHVAGKS